MFSITLRGSINTLKQLTNWRTTWTQIIPGNFGGGTGLTDLLFYNASLGAGDFYATSLLDVDVGSCGRGVGDNITQVNRPWSRCWTMPTRECAACH